MSQKEKFDACMRLADFYAQSVYNRQGYQWKVTIGLWTVLIASTGFLFGKQITPIPKWFYWTVLLAYAFIWVRAVAINNYYDQRSARHFRNEARAVLLDESHNIVSVPEEASAIATLRWLFQFAIVWAHQFEVVATGLIIFASILLLKSR
jgi:hypothetical protein